MNKNFLDISKGDIVVAFDEYSHDYVEHRLRIESIEFDKEWATESNPDGKICYGTDLGDWGDDYMTSVTEANFVCIKKKTKMTKVVIVVKDGMVQEVLSNTNIDVELLDFDSQDEAELKKNNRRYAEIQKSETFKEMF